MTDTVMQAADGSWQDVLSRSDGLTLPHPLTHLRAFVLIPWLDVEPDAQLPITDTDRPVARLLAEIDAVERTGVRPTDLELRR